MAIRPMTGAAIELTVRGYEASRRSRIRVSALAFGAAMIALLGESSPAAAQSPASAASSPEDVTVDAVVVTASRVERAGFVAPTPTTVVSSEELALKGVANIAEGLNQVPAFFANTTPATGGNSRSSGNAQYLNLRALGANRTLILVNGRRYVPTTPTGVLDVNLVPQALVGHVEVVTGGASAAWGSDAVAGVVNFIFDSDFEGSRAELQYGVSSRGDNEEYKLVFSHGMGFADGRGHLAVAGEIYENEGVLDQTDRPWGRQEWQIVNNGQATPANGQPRRLRSPFVHQSNRTEGGLIVTPGPLQNIQFGPRGAVLPFAVGRNVGGGFMIGGDGLNQGSVTSLVTPGERQTLYGVASYEISPDLKASLEASYARIDSRNNMLASFSPGPYTIKLDNPYIPEAVRSLAVASGVAQFQLGRVNTDFGFIVAHPKNETARIVAALDGGFGESWKWSAYYTFGRNEALDRTEHNLIVARLAAAIDAVRDPVSGQIVCRSASVNPGCVPINLFGYGSPSAAAVASVTGDTVARTVNDQHVWAATLSGEPFQTWAGPVSIATGAEFRRESINSSVDAVSAANGFLVGNPKALSGKYSAKEIFLEAVVPLLADQPFAKSVEFNGAARLTDYSSSGQVVTWKAGLTYEINDSIRLRGAVSRDIRAANLSELFQSSATNFGVVRDPRPVSGNSAPLINTITGGNRNLDPEKADTVTAGIVLSPSFLPGLRAAIDYYDIDIQGAIGTLRPQEIIDRCFVGGSSDLCRFITIDSANTITRVDTSFINLQQIKTRGVDAEISYSREIAGGDLTVRLLGTNVLNLITSDGVVAIDRVGQASGQAADSGLPRWRATGNVIYKAGPLVMSATARYVGGGRVDVTYGPGDIDDNTVESRTYLDLGVQYTFERDERSLELFGVVNNVMDRDPPLVGSTFQAPFYTNPALYDVVGRAMKVGLRIRY